MRTSKRSIVATKREAIATFIFILVAAILSVSAFYLIGYEKGKESMVPTKTIYRDTPCPEDSVWWQYRAQEVWGCTPLDDLPGDFLDDTMGRSK